MFKGMVRQLNGSLLGSSRVYGKSTLTGRRGLINQSPFLTARQNSNGNIRSYATVKTDNIDWNPMSTSKQLIKGRELTGKYSRKVVLVILCLTPLVTFGLGVWQVKRLEWKNKLVAECEDRLTYKASPLPKNIKAEDVPNFEYRKVLITGHFDYEREVYVGPRLHDGSKGYLVICPFVQSNGSSVILVDRGWIADNRVIPERRNLQHLSCPQGEITIQCVLRVPPEKGMFHMDHVENSRLFHYVDIKAIAKYTGASEIYAQVLEDFGDHPERLASSKPSSSSSSSSSTDGSSSGSHWWKFWGGKTASNSSASKLINESKDEMINVVASPYESDATEEYSPLQFVSAGVPLGKVPKIDYKNNHMQYLVTWFGLSFASVILLFLTLKKSKIINPKDEKLRHARKILG